MRLDEKDTAALHSLVDCETGQTEWEYIFSCHGSTASKDASFSKSLTHKYIAMSLNLARKVRESHYRPTDDRFTGEQTDNNDLVFLRARYLNLGMGVFVSQDSMENLNRYAYVGGNVTNRVDHSGLAWEIPDNCNGRSLIQYSQSEPSLPPGAWTACPPGWTAVRNTNIDCRNDATGMILQSAASWLYEMGQPGCPAGWRRELFGYCTDLINSGGTLSAEEAKNYVWRTEGQQASITGTACPPGWKHGQVVYAATGEIDPSYCLSSSDIVNIGQAWYMTIEQAQTTSVNRPCDSFWGDQYYLLLDPVSYQRNPHPWSPDPFGYASCLVAVGTPESELCPPNWEHFLGYPDPLFSYILDYQTNMCHYTQNIFDIRGFPFDAPLTETWARHWLECDFTETWKSLLFDIASLLPMLEGWASVASYASCLDSLLQASHNSNLTLDEFISNTFAKKWG